MPNRLGKTEICNIALRRLGVRPVNDVDHDNINAAYEMRALWSMAVESTLRAADWAFARKVVPLAELADEKALGWQYVYMYPRDCMMFWGVESAVSIRNPEIRHRWEIQRSAESNQQVILADVPQAYGRYTAMLADDPTQWDGTFVDALGWRLAMDACQKLAADTGLFQKCTQMYSATVAGAQTMNKLEHGNHEHYRGFFINCR